MFDASLRKLSKTRISAATFCKSGIVLSALLLGACGYVSDIMPPALNLPSKAADVTAVEHGAVIAIGFEMPKLTTEGARIRHQPRIDLRIGPAPANLYDIKTWLEHAKEVPVTGAQIEIPVAAWVNQKVAIGLRLQNDRGKDAGWAEPLVAVTVIPPLDVPKNLAAASQPEGVSLHWTSTAPRFRVFRRGPDTVGFSQIATPDKPSYDDPVGFDKEYSYYVQAIAPAGEGTAESDHSAPVVITPKDTFPPASPTGLAYILGGKTIELSWAHSTESDLAGYRVYRAFENNAFERVTGTRESTSYSDHNIEPGKHYRYAVTAIDRAGNESKLSEPITVTAP
jgi:hypothetical protein